MLCTMLKLRITLFLTLLSLTTFAQIEIIEASTNVYSPENLIYNYFKGEGVNILNVKYDGPTMSVGYFDKGKNAFGIEKGIVMTTGRVKTTSNGSAFLYGIDAVGKEQADNNNGSTVTDVDAIAIAKAVPQNLVRYTITFQPSSDTLRFRYVFASEEYPEYACKEYNDLFGFFISGPGINGTFQDKGINIARIPNTDKSVTINNIHPAYSINNCPAAFAEMYHSNFNNQPVFDGYLDVFTAAVPVIPCQTYTIKLVIADVGDKRLDSGVFLEAKSFGTNALRAEVTNAVAVEGCSDGKVTFKLSQAKNFDYIVPLKIIGGSAETSDFQPIPTSITIPKGELNSSFLLKAIKDQITEDFESIGVEYTINSCRKDTIWLYLKDYSLTAPELGADKSICEGSNTSLDATVQFSLPKEKIFSNTLPFDINTIGNGSTNPPTVSEIKVTGVAPSQLKAGAIESVCLNINHERAEDLDLVLIAPNGKFIELSSDNGAKGKNYSNTCFSPKATSKITAASAPFSGNYQPESKWEDLFSEGENPINGVWKLQVIDDQVGMKGTLQNWSINFKPPYNVTYQWTPSEGLSCKDCATPNAKPSKTTSYKVIVTDTYGCQVKDSIKIFVTNEIPAPNVVCQSTTTNSVTFAWQNAAGANNGYEISLNGGSWLTPKNTYSHTVDNLDLGQKINAQVRAKGSSGCNGGGAQIGTAECKTPDCIPPTLSIQSTKNESCFGKKDGAITLKSNAVDATYKMDNQQNKTGVFTALSAGKYRATVVEKNCSAVVDVEIQSPEAIKIIPLIKDASCAGSKNGSIALSVSGGILPYTYTWDNGQKEATIQNLNAGLYGVIVYDKNGCSSKESLIIKELANMSLMGEMIPVACYGEASGGVNLRVEGGTAPLSFQWSNQSTAANLTKVKAGNYSVIVKDAANCLAQKTFSVVSPESPMFVSLSQSSTLCFGEKGYVSSFVTGGTAPISYKWNTGEITAELKEITAGLYKVIVTDANGCVRSDSTKIIGVEDIKLQSNSKAASCFNGQDGSATIQQVFNGNTPVPLSEMYYRWSIGFQTPEAINLKGGEKYSVTVTNKLGCSTVKTFTIGQPKEIAVNITQQTDAKCFENADGSATVAALGGNAPYQYTWDAAAQKQTTATATNLKSGTYYVGIKDSKGCETQTKVTIKAPNKLKVSHTPTNVACKDGASGKLESSIVGGTPPYQYAWNDGSNTPTIENLKVGNYILTVTDKNACVASQTMKILEPEALKATIETTGATCAGLRDGKIRIFAQGGISPYKYSIDSKIFNGVSTIVGLKSGYYNIAVKDLRGCVTLDNGVFIEEPEAIKIDLGEDIMMEYGDTITLSLDKYFARNQTFKYLWKTDHSKFISCTECPSTKVFPSNTATYRLQVTNKDGCTASDDIMVKVNYAPVIEVPTGFSPNGDGNNDVLTVLGDNTVKIKYFSLFSRDGSMVYNVENFYIGDAKMGWDGTHRGQKMLGDTYIWGMEVEYPNGLTETLKGNTTLIKN